MSAQTTFQANPASSMAALLPVPGDTTAAINLATMQIPTYLPDSMGDMVRNGGLAPWQRKKVLAFIEENLTETIRIEQLADLVRLSVSYFSRAFRLSFDKPPYGYIQERRVSFAKMLMTDTDDSLSQIALECGMTDQAHFSKVFRKIVGTSPDRWRRPRRQPGNSPTTSAFERRVAH